MTITELLDVLDVPDVLDDLAAIVAERGTDYVYTAEHDACVYFDGSLDKPSCIVGHVLARHGLERDSMQGALGLLGYPRTWREDSSSWPPRALDPAARAVTEALTAEVYPARDVLATEAAARVLQAAQTTQDSDGGTWGQALSAAQEVAARLAEATP